jgi:tetratricopeptide (TPR) repeat protein
MPRTAELERVSNVAGSHIGVVIQGRAKAGKRYLAHALALSLASQPNILWFNLSNGSTLGDVMSRLERVDPPLESTLDRAIPALIEWLVVNDAVIVLAGVNALNAPTFAPLLQLLPQIKGPTRIIVTTAFREAGPHVHEIAPFTGDEAIDALSSLGVAHDRGEIRALAGEFAIYPYHIRQAALLGRTMDRQQVQIGEDKLYAEVVDGLPELLRECYEIFQILVEDLDLGLVGEILAALGAEQPPFPILEEFERRLLLRRTGAATWRVEANRSELVPRCMSETKVQTLLVHLADYFSRLVERDGSDPRRLSDHDWPRLLAACRLLQLANAQRDRRDWLRSQFTTIAERRGAFQQLVAIHAYEVNLGDWSDPWLQFRYSRHLWVLGRYPETLELLDELFHRLVEHTEPNADLYWSVTRLLSETLIEAGHPEIAVRILDGVFDKINISELSSKICVQSVSVLSWALAVSDQGEACLELNSKALRADFEGLAEPFSLHIANIRMGIALQRLERFDEAIAALEPAYRFFAAHDARAFGWCAINLTLALHGAGRRDEAIGIMRAAIATNASRCFHNGEMLTAYRLCRADPIYQELWPGIDAELDRLASYEATLKKVGSEIANSKLVKHVMIDLAVDLGVPYAFDARKYALFSLTAPPAIASNFSQTMVRRLRDAGLEAILDGIFVEKQPAAIFRSHIYNRLVSEACNRERILYKKYMIPHLSSIAMQADGIILFYARCLEAGGYKAEALGLLDALRQKDGFSYFNVRANCLAHSEPLKALELNDEALRRADSREREAQILNNKARIVLESGMRHLFEAAEGWCEQAIRLRPVRFHYPKNMLLLLRLSRSPFAQLRELIAAHQARFKTRHDVLVRSLEVLKPDRLRRRALAAALDLNQSETGERVR